MDYRTWIKQVDEDRLQGSYFILKSEPYLWESMKNVLKNDVVGDSLIDFNYERIHFLEADQNDFDNILETMPIMSDKRVVVMEHLPLQKDQVKKYEEKLDVLNRYLENPNPSTLLFLSFDGSSPFNGKSYQKLKKHVHLVELSRLENSELKRCIERKFQKKGLRYENSIVPAIISASDYLEKDSEKTLYDVENITEQVIGTEYMGTLYLDRAQKVLINPIEDNIFQLMDAISDRNAKKCLILYHGFLQLGQDPISLFYMIVRQIRNLIGVSLVQNRRMMDRDAQKRLKLSPFEYKKLKQKTNLFSLSELLQLHERLFEMERDMKTIPFKMDFAIEQFLMKVCDTKR